MNKGLKDKVQELRWTGKCVVGTIPIIAEVIDGVKLYKIQSTPIVIKLTPEEAVLKTADMQRIGSWLKPIAQLGSDVAYLGIHGIGRGIAGAGNLLIKGANKLHK
jgi:hypothetical protein